MTRNKSWKKPLRRLRPPQGCKSSGAKTPTDLDGKAMSQSHFAFLTTLSCEITGPKLKNKFFLITRSSPKPLSKLNKALEKNLITEYVSKPQAEKLRSLDVPFFDTAGNAYFKESDLYIFVSGQKKTITREKIPSLFRPPGMKLLFALLTKRGWKKKVIELSLPRRMYRRRLSVYL